MFTDEKITELDRQFQPLYEALWGALKPEEPKKLDDEFKPILKKMQESEAKMAGATRVLLDMEGMDFDLFGRDDTDEEFI